MSARPSRLVRAGGVAMPVSAWLRHPFSTFQLWRLARAMLKVARVVQRGTLALGALNDALAGVPDA